MTTVRLAQGEDELESAYRLLHEEYVRCGYDDPEPSGLRFLPCYALPTTHTFVALEAGEVTGTVTLVLRGALGLPMEPLCSRELLLARAPGRTIAEVSGLALRGADRAASLLLFRALTGFARYALKVSDLCIMVTEPHARFYANALLFEPMGPVRSCAQVNGTRGLPMRLDLTTAESRYTIRHPDGVIGRHLAPWGLDREGLDYPGLARDLEKGLLAAALARLRLAQRMLAQRRWEPRERRAIARECRRSTRRFLRAEAMS